MIGPIRLAIADDARFMRDALARLLETDARVLVVGTAASGEELLAHLDEWQPDAVTLDLEMPGQGGLATLDQIIARRPMPVIILSTHSGEGAPVTVEALSRGAADFIDKEAYSLVDFKTLREVLVGKLLHVTGRANPQDALPAEAPPRTADAPRRRDARTRRTDPPAPAASLTARPPVRPPAQGVALVVIGASTGGPRAVESVLRAMGPISPPVLVVQHMPEGFTTAFAERLCRTLGVPVAEAVDGEALQGGTVRIAPAGRHLTVVETSGAPRVVLSAEPAGLLHRPSVDVTLQSAALAAGPRAVGVLLTGMGSDGAEGMVALARRGALTIAQDEASCVVFGMPRAAIVRGGAVEVLPLDAIGPRLGQVCTGTVACAAEA